MFNRENRTSADTALRAPLGASRKPALGSENEKLIYTSKIGGITVRNSTGQDIGHVEDVAIDSVTGEIAYAVLALGGFLGIGERLHPVPWPVLKYDPGKNCFLIALSGEEFRAAPAYSKAAFAELRDKDKEFPHNIFAYYGIYT